MKGCEIMEASDSIKRKINKLIDKAIANPEKYHPEQGIFVARLLDDGTRFMCNVFGEPVEVPDCMKDAAENALAKLEQIHLGRMAEKPPKAV